MAFMGFSFSLRDEYIVTKGMVADIDLSQALSFSLHEITGRMSWYVVFCGQG